VRGVVTRRSSPADQHQTGGYSSPSSRIQWVGAWRVINQTIAGTIAAFTERLARCAEQPGANDAGVLNYIYLAPLGAYGFQGFLPARAFGTTR